MIEIVTSGQQCRKWFHRTCRHSGKMKEALERCSRGEITWGYVDDLHCETCGKEWRVWVR